MCAPTLGCTAFSLYSLGCLLPSRVARSFRQDCGDEIIAAVLGSSLLYPLSGCPLHPEEKPRSSGPQNPREPPPTAGSPLAAALASLPAGVHPQPFSQVHHHMPPFLRHSPPHLCHFLYWQVLLGLFGPRMEAHQGQGVHSWHSSVSSGSTAAPGAAQGLSKQPCMSRRDLRYMDDVAGGPRAHRGALC